MPAPITLAVPPSGWLRTERERLGWSRRVVAEKLQVSPAAVRDYEQSEVNGTISLRTLARAANAMNCRLIVALVPADGHPAPSPAPRRERRVAPVTSAAAPLDTSGELDDHLK